MTLLPKIDYTFIEKIVILLQGPSNSFIYQLMHNRVALKEY